MFLFYVFSALKRNLFIVFEIFLKILQIKKIYEAIRYELLFNQQLFTLRIHRIVDSVKVKVSLTSVTAILIRVKSSSLLNTYIMYVL